STRQGDLAGATCEKFSSSRFIPFRSGHVACCWGKTMQIATTGSGSFFSAFASSRRTMRVFASVVVGSLLCALPVHAQPWSGVLDPTRATDWTHAGITGGIPNGRTQCGSPIAAYSGTAAPINSAIASCGANQFVQLGSGTFNLSSGIGFAGKNNVTLRGNGPELTILKFSA